MDRGSPEGWHMLDQFPLDSIHDRVSFRDRQSPVDRDVKISVHTVAKPASSHFVHPLDAVDMQWRVLNLSEDAGFDAVEQA